MREIKRIIFSDVVVGETIQLTITEFHDKYDVEEALFFEMLEYGLFEPRKIETETIYLDLDALRRIQSALRLQRDLGVNLPGAALVLDLMKELDELRRELATLQK
ncbi:MAG: chaperone modulator CbpM [Gammaproteobacteria bacterium]|nr:chaperone modulator CbpM [Gammaproteobacteria bacterium]